MWSILTVEYCSASNRKDILTTVKTRMNLEDMILSDISQSKKDKCRTIH